MPTKISIFPPDWRLLFLNLFAGILFVAVILVPFLPSSHAMSLDGKEGHRAYWNQVIGIKDSSSENHPMRKCWKEFQEAIDDQTGYPYMQAMIREFGIKHDYQCGHRTYFHWGFHANKKNIVYILRKCIESWEDLDEEKRNRIVEKLINDTKKRNQNMIKAVRKGTRLTRTQASPLAAIIYDVHILTDWKTSHIRPLASPQNLIKELNKSIIEISRGPGKAYELGKNLRKRLKEACRVSGDREKAKGMLSFLIHFFPDVLWEKYGNKLPFKRQ